MQKIILFHLSILQIQSILKSHNMTGHNHFWPRQPLKLSYFFMKLYQYAKNKLIPMVNSILESSDQIGHINMLKMRLFHQFAQEK